MFIYVRINSLSVCTYIYIDTHTYQIPVENLPSRFVIPLMIKYWNNEIFIKLSYWKIYFFECKVPFVKFFNLIFFSGILQRTGIDINEKTLKSLQNKYNVKRDLPLNYWIFLKKFLIQLNSEQTQIKDWGSKKAVSLRL